LKALEGRENMLMFDVGCLDLEVRTFVVYGCSNVGGRDYEGRNDKI
jgi:hypothetical protein